MIVFPMAGESSRFKKAGFAQPKYRLKAHGKTLFEHAVESFAHYYTSEHFLFICLASHASKQFIDSRARQLGIANFSIIELPGSTGGQADSVYQGLMGAEVAANEAITIFNIDTFRPGFRYPDFLRDQAVAGYLETFIGSGANWSNIIPTNQTGNKVAFTAEKQQISQYCCTGLYYWRSKQLYCDVFESCFPNKTHQATESELYIAPMFNTLIEEHQDVRFSVIERSQVIFCGTPQEYRQYTSVIPHSLTPAE